MIAYSRNKFINKHIDHARNMQTSTKGWVNITCYVQVTVLMGWPKFTAHPLLSNNIIT